MFLNTVQNQGELYITKEMGYECLAELHSRGEVLPMSLEEERKRAVAGNDVDSDDSDLFRHAHGERGGGDEPDGMNNETADNSLDHYELEEDHEFSSNTNGQRNEKEDELEETVVDEVLQEPVRVNRERSSGSQQVLSKQIPSFFSDSQVSHSKVKNCLV
jgi:hypothetical protein